MNDWARLLFDADLGSPGFGAERALFVVLLSFVIGQFVGSAASYLASVMPVVHFGLGPAESVERLTLRWPGGRHLRIGPLPADHRLFVRHRPRGSPAR